MDKSIKDNIKIARRCMNFSGIKCSNKTCTNEYCPLNEVYDCLSLKYGKERTKETTLLLNPIKEKSHAEKTEEHFGEDKFGSRKK